MTLVTVYVDMLLCWTGAGVLLGRPHPPRLLPLRTGHPNNLDNSIYIHYNHYPSIITLTITLITLHV